MTRGAAFGDIDDDGDIDIVISNNNGPARLLLNELPPSNWLEVRATGGQSQGALVTLIRRGRPPLVRRIHTDSSYCSASDARAHFGLGSDGGPSDSVEAQWPDGTRERWRHVPANQVFSIVRGSGESVR